MIDNTTNKLMTDNTTNKLSTFGGQMYDALVLGAEHRASLVTARSLGSRGLRIAVLGPARAPVFSSRWCQQAFVYPSSESTEAYLHNLEQLLDHTGVRVLIPLSDGAVELVRRHRERLEQRVRIALAKEPALGIAINKEQTLEVARQLGLGVPRALSLRSVSEVGTALHEIGLPAVVKPIESWVWDRGQRLTCKLVATPEEARRAVEDLTSMGETVLFQQFLSGKREAINLFYAHGNIYARFAQWARRTEPPLGGASVLRQSIAPPQDISDQAERLVREIDLEGYSEVEFRRDSVGVPYLMEMNPRLSASIELAVRSGVDFPYLLYQWANEGQVDTVNSYQTGRWQRYLMADITTTVKALQQHGRPGVTPPARTIFDFCASFFMPMSYDYVDRKDLLPAWTAAVNFARDLPRMVRKSFSKNDDGKSVTAVW